MGRLLGLKILNNNFMKRFFDFSLALMGLFLFFWLIALAWLIAAFETRSNGFFIQNRVGRYGGIFGVIKIKTMYTSKNNDRSTITAAHINEITISGKWMRRFKIDELPQLWNVLIGQMSFVGPRPDVSGYADKLEGEARKILELRPGITGPASLKYKNEEELLSKASDSKKYNDEVIWPDKVKINLNYYYKNNFIGDLIFILKTIF